MVKKSFLAAMPVKPTDKTDEELLKEISDNPQRKAKAKTDEDTTRINIFLPKALHSELKACSALQGKSMNDMVVGLINQFIRQG